MIDIFEVSSFCLLRVVTKCLKWGKEAKLSELKRVESSDTFLHKWCIFYVYYTLSVKKSIENILFEIISRKNFSFHVIIKFTFCRLFLTDKVCVTHSFSSTKETDHEFCFIYLSKKNIMRMRMTQINIRERWPRGKELIS